jgi:hypothetical protein
LDKKETKRITFNEITKTAILKAIENPREIDKNLVDAQQARRVLDRIVGFELSPVLWKKVRPSLSAGRVQSVAVRLIVEREKEIENHQSARVVRVQGIFHALKALMDALSGPRGDIAVASERYLTRGIPGASPPTTEGVVLDMVLHNNHIYMLRTSGGDGSFYKSAVVQKVAYPSLSSSVIYNSNRTPFNGQAWLTWVPWMLVIDGKLISTSDRFSGFGVTP